MSLVGTNYIAPDRFDHFVWLEPKRPAWAPRWFYWRELSKPNSGNFVDLETVDPFLKPIVAMAHRHNLRTLPSCQGHFPREADVREQYQWLVTESPKIRVGALPLRDVETDVQYTYRDPAWKLPYERDFVQSVMAHVGTGRIGIVFDEKEDADLMSHLCDHIGKTQTTGTKFSITVSDDSDLHLAQRWQAVFSKLQRVLP